jgi:putative Ca2+/H+ antiporter (TMEM165/GDT1 family)
MNLKLIFTAFILFAIGQSVVWFQVNGPIIWPIAKQYRWILILLGIPITYIFMKATESAVNGFDGEFWPSRFVSFVIGIIIFSVLTWIFRGEGINIKTAVCLCLAVTIIFIQLFWK